MVSTSQLSMRLRRPVKLYQKEEWPTSTISFSGRASSQRVNWATRCCVAVMGVAIG